ncbi:MAG: Stf0 family sulfotransferase, partial [Pseudomonadota bacterium]
ERLTAAFGRFRIIYLEREDKLQQAISLTIAQQSGLWHRAADGSELERIAPPSAPFYDRGKILANLTDLTSQNAAWRAWFDQEDLAPHILKYEALAADPHGELAKTLSALDLDPTAARNLPLPTSKLADATNAAWAAKYRAELTS